MCGHAGFEPRALLAPHRLQKLITIAVPYGPQVMQAVIENYDQLRRSWHMFFFQSPLAEMAVSHNDFEFLERLWHDWSPAWTIPVDEIAALKATFRQPGELEAALGYYRQTFHPTSAQTELVDLQAKIMTAPIEVSTLGVYGERDGCIGVELLEGMEALFPQGLRRAIIPQAGHFVHQEEPGEGNRVLLEFLADAP